MPREEDRTCICSSTSNHDANHNSSTTSSEDESNDEKDRYYHGSSHSKFTILQSRNIIPSSTTIVGSGSNDGNQQGLQQIIIENWISLCSSMDLIAIRNSLESIIIYRTLSWQRLLVIGPSDLVAAISANKSSSNNNNNNNKNDNTNIDSRYHPPSSKKTTPKSSSFPTMDLDSNIIAVAETACPTMNTTAETRQQRETTRNSSTTEGITCITWSPDGRALAVGLQNGQVLLFTIEGGIRLVYTTARATFQTSKARSSASEPCPPPPPTTPPSTSTILTRSRTAAIRRQQQQQLLVSTRNTNIEEQKVIHQQSTSIAATNIVNLQEQQLLEPLDPQVIGLCWAKRISYNYPKYLLYPQEQEGYDAWAIQCQYLNRATDCLMYEPWHDMVDSTTSVMNNNTPIMSIGAAGRHLSDSTAQEDGGRQTQTQLDWNGTSNSPSTLATLNILCVAGAANSLSIYLHGRYRIATLVPPPQLLSYNRHQDASSTTATTTNNNNNKRNISTQIVCSLDLSSVLLLPNQDNSKMIMIIHDIPIFTLRYHELSWISSSFCFMAANLHKAYRTVEDVSLHQWKDIFQPLEQLLLSWKDLFQQYGVPMKDSTTTLRAELLRYLTLGQCTSNYMEGSAEACHQFFANYCNINNINENNNTASTLPRMAKSIENGLMAMEHRIRSTVQAASQALLYSTSELFGLARSTCCEDPALLNCAHAQVAMQISEQLCIITEHCIVDLLRLRHLIRDFFSWLIGEVSYVKAEEQEGSDQAHSKRPSPTIQRKVASFLSSAASLEGNQGKEREGFYETERLLGINLSEYFTKNLVHALDSKGNEITRPSLRSVLIDVREILFSLFAYPREIINRSANGIALSFSSRKVAYCTLPAAHKRCGMCSEEPGDTGFRPSLLQKDQNDIKGAGDDVSFDVSRNWLILAQGSTLSGENTSIIQIVALPSILYNENTDTVARPSYYLTAFMELPYNCKCEEVFFYGDDGNSSLSVVQDTNDPAEISNPEGRQSLGLIVEVKIEKRRSDYLMQQELWLVPYETLKFKVVNFHCQSKTIEFEGMTNQDYAVRVVREKSEIKKEEILCNRRRKICSMSSKSEPSSLPGRSVISCGSRGVVGIVNKGKILTLLDVEEDEEVDLSDEENSTATDTDLT